MNTENRVSPQAPEIEEAIIGACLIEQRAIPLIADKLRPVPIRVSLNSQK